MIPSGENLMPTPLQDFSKLCVHTMTTRLWSIEEVIDEYASAGIEGVSVWRNTLANRDPAKIGDRFRAAGLTAVSLVRGGFFPAVDPAGRQRAIEENLKAIDEAAGLGAPLVVLVCGATPEQALESSRQQITAGIAAILPYAEANSVKLAIEPLHPMYADSRSTINTLKQANDLAQDFDSPYLGVAVDVYHLWWDPELEAEIRRCGRAGKLLAFHICDWMTPTQDLLNDRGLMGEGCIPVPRIRGWVEEAGFNGFCEVEIFSTRHWAKDPRDLLQEIKAAYLNHS
jgi:sugar phosphate isomerase/epimerase